MRFGRAFLALTESLPRVEERGAGRARADEAKETGVRFSKMRARVGSVRLGLAWQPLRIGLPPEA